MKILNCLFCSGELDIIGEEGYHKKVRCRECGFESEKPLTKKEPEVLFIRKNERSS